MDGKLIDKASLARLWTPARLNDGIEATLPAQLAPWTHYGLGWLLIPQGAHPATGGSGGVRSAFIVYPRDGLAVVVFTNTQGSQPDSLASDVARFYLHPDH